MWVGPQDDPDREGSTFVWRGGRAEIPYVRIPGGCRMIIPIEAKIQAGLRTQNVHAEPVQCARDDRGARGLHDGGRAAGTPARGGAGST